jgi:hypothetical protein
MSTRKPKKPETPWSALLGMLVTMPLLAVPFAGFFLLMEGAGWKLFPLFWLAALIFSMPVGLANWGVGQFLAPVMVRRFGGDLRRTWWITGAHLAASLAGSVASIVILGLTLIPDFLHHGRNVIVALVYSSLFAVLFLGIALVAQFYRKAVSAAGSERELQLARRIQRSFLLTQFPSRPRLEVHAVNVSSKEVSGDFYDVVDGDEGTLVLAVADVSGKGVPAALLSSMIQASLRTQAGAAASPAAMTAIVNRLACERDSTGQFATMFLAVVDEATLTLRYTNAGHNFPVLVRAGGERVLLETGGLLTGMMPGVPYDEAAIALQPGDRLVVYTDGVTEAANAEGEMLGEERLYQMLAAMPRTLSARESVESLLAGVFAFLGGTEPGDDITVLALRVPEPAAGPRP